jgi:amino acid transporter
MSDIELTYREFYLYIVIGGAILGALFGLVPLILGRRRGKPRLGWYGLIASTVGGAISVLLALIVTGIFSWLIVRNPSESASAQPESGRSEESRPD